MPTLATLAAYSSWSGWIMATRFGCCRSSTPTSVCSAAMPYLARSLASIDSTCCWSAGVIDRQPASTSAARTTLLPPNRMEHHRERRVRLPAVLRAEAEEHDAAFAIRHRHGRGLAREALLAVDPPRQQNVARLLGVRHEHPSLHLVARQRRVEGDGAVDVDRHLRRQRGRDRMFVDVHAHERPRHGEFG